MPILCIFLTLCNAFCYIEVSCNLISQTWLCEVFICPVTKYPSSQINWGQRLLKDKNLLLFLIALKVTCEMPSTYTRVGIKLEALFWYHLFSGQIMNFKISQDKYVLTNIFRNITFHSVTNQKATEIQHPFFSYCLTFHMSYFLINVNKDDRRQNPWQWKFW